MSTSAWSFTRKLAGGAIAALTLTGALALSATPAAASWRHHHGYHGHHHHHGHHYRRHHRAYGYYCATVPRRVVDRYGRVHVSHVRICR